MVDAKASKPLYEQIKDYIVDNIQSGTFQPDSRIPSERVLSEQFGVSRLTVKQALKELMYDGLLYVQIGKGTFIKRPTYNQQLETLTGFSDDARSRGQHPSSQVLRADISAASDDLARILKILPGSNLVVLERVRLVDNEPIALESCHLVASLYPNLLRHDFARESLYQVLRQDYDVRLIYAEQTIEARPATRTEAQMLCVKTGSPVLFMTRVTYAETDKPVEYVRSVYRGDRYKFRAVLRQL